MSAGTRSSAMTATAPASSAIFACSAFTTSMMTPPLSISASPRLTRLVPSSPAPLLSALLLSLTVAFPLGCRSAPRSCAIQSQRRDCAALAAWGCAPILLRLGLRPGRGDIRPHLAKKLRYGLRFRDDGEEVRIQCPAGNDVLMEMVGDARARDPPLVHSEIEPVTVRNLAQHAHGRLGQTPHLGDLVGVGLVVARDVPVGTHQQVPGVIGEQVKQHVAVLTTGDDE